MGALIAGVLSAVVVTSLISGVIGMAGGMILMGLLMVLLPVETAMIFHGVTQLAANGSRAFFFRRHLRLGVLPPYLLGASLCLTLFFGVSYRASEGVVCLVLGALPYLGLILPRAPGLDIAHRPTAFVCGFSVTVAQLLAGVSGPLLDLFFLQTKLDRCQIVGTKALTQSLAHLFKLCFYLRFATGGGSMAVPEWLFVAAIAGSWIGTYAGKLLLARMTDETFRKASQRVLLVLGAFYIWRGWALILAEGV